MSRFMDITGRRYGMLVALSYYGAKNGAQWICACDCGGFKLARTRSLNYGSTKSCGCQALKNARDNLAAARKRKTHPYPHTKKLKDVRRNMISRCYEPTNKRWENYGGRGITVCDEWRQSPAAFYKWATENGYAPGLTIDRIDVHGNYRPENCRFVDAFVQMNNTTRNVYIEWNGKTQSLSDWARELNLSYAAMQYRVETGWDMDKIASTPQRAY